MADSGDNPRDVAMKLGSAVGMRDNPDSFARHLRSLEDAGVEYLWCGEAYTADRGQERRR
jgi:hypothetical protein